MPETQNKNKFIRLLNYSGNYKYLTIVGMFFISFKCNMFIGSICLYMGCGQCHIGGCP